MSAFPSIEISRILDTPIDDGHGQILPEFVACGSANSSDCKDALCGRFLNTVIAVQTSFVTSLWLIARRWRGLRLRALQVCMLCGRLWQFSIRRGCRLVNEPLLPFRRKIFQVFFCVARRTDAVGNLDLTSILPDNVTSQKNPTKGGRIDISCTVFVRTQQSRRRYRLQTGFDLPHWLCLCPRRFGRCGATISRLDDDNLVWKILLLTTSVFHISTMARFLLGTNVCSLLQWPHKRVTSQFVQGWPWMRSLIRSHAMLDSFVQCFGEDFLQHVFIVYVFASQWNGYESSACCVGDIVKVKCSTLPRNRLWWWHHQWHRFEEGSLPLPGQTSTFPFLLLAYSKMNSDSDENAHWVRRWMSPSWKNETTTFRHLVESVSIARQLKGKYGADE